MRRLSVVALALGIACSSANVKPTELDGYLLRQSDAPATAKPEEKLSGAQTLASLRSIFVLSEETTVALKNAGFEAARATAFSVPTATCMAVGCPPATSRLLRSIAISFFSRDGAAEAMSTLRTAIARYSRNQHEEPGLGESAAVLEGGAPTPKTWVVWRRGNVVVVLLQSPTGDARETVRLAKAIDARAAGH